MNATFYDALAQDYYLVFADWQASMNRQGAWLDGLMRSEWRVEGFVQPVLVGTRRA
ncbi:MAG TPA: hypothetical protein VGM44_03180 [Polyangiaceae bacterium]|jgi:hypothetical protein